jgi:outer membrane protein
MRLPLLRTLLLSASFAAGAFHGATAAPIIGDAIPFLNDPLNSKADIAPYAQNRKLHPATCPAIPTDKHIYTLEEVVVLSLCNNPDTRSAYLALAASGYSYVQNYSGYFPSVTGNLGYAHETFFSPHSQTNTRGSGVSASMTLYDFGQRELSVDIAEQTLLAAGNSYTSTLQGTIATALKGYYTLLTSQNDVAVTEESERFAQAGYEAAKLKHEIGQVALADELQAKSSYSSAVLSTQSARNSLAIEKASLARLMGLPPEESVQVAELDDTNLTLQPFGGELPRLIAEAKQKRVDLISQRAALESAKISLKKTQRENLATVAATVDGGFNKSGILRGNGSGSNAVGVSVSIPIFTGFTQTYNERLARNTVAAQNEALTATELNVEQDVWNAWHNYQTAQKSWETSLDLIQSATEFKDVALGRYKEGIGTILDVLSAQSQYTNALQSQLNTRYNLLTTRIDLVRAVGVLDLDTMRAETTVPLAPGAAPLPQQEPIEPPAAPAITPSAAPSAPPSLAPVPANMDLKPLLPKAIEPTTP